MPLTFAPLLRRAAGWVRRQPLFIPLVMAVAISSLLGVVVLAPLVVSPGGGADDTLAGAAPGLSASDPPPAAATRTPEPDATSTPWPQRPRLPSPTPEPTAIRTGNARTGAAPTTTPSPEPKPTETPEPTPKATATETATPEPSVALYRAEAGDGLEAWGGPHWSVDGEVLVNDGGAVTAQPWLTAPEFPPVDASYAVEAEFRVLGVAAGYCQQSFGVVAVSPSGAAYWGGGLIYFCDNGDPVVRITNVTDWTDGYNADPELSSKRLNPGGNWHTLRLEVDEGLVRLLIDGEVVLEAADPIGGAATARVAEFGLWSQGVQVAIRRITVEPIAEPV